ncbi:MAG: hypothetical protein ONB46_10930 [candidate division KSB1 bacterium]|nr:hypothetical protein [candidate division KSB1 bacterium]MDZ7366397.1 hypothetical protein [candidate division KSB1 bacterium]MDZ7404052.1 hypothetical protein [candidate division KSB1 bacterium]
MRKTVRHRDGKHHANHVNHRSEKGEGVLKQIPARNNSPRRVKINQFLPCDVAIIEKTIMTAKIL